MNPGLFRLALAAICLTGPLITQAEDNPLAKYLDAPGARTTLPVNSAKSPFSLAFVQDAQERFENFHYQLGGDHALYYNLHLSEVLPTAVSKPNQQYRPLDKALDPDVGDKVSFTTKEGELTLNQYVVHPNHRVQSVVMVHEGRIVYETYPGMNPMDQHVWMSPGKSTVGLVIAQLEAEGKIDMDKEVVEYLPEFKGTNWDGIRMLDAANMATALQLEETLEAIVDPESIIVRFFSAEFGAPNPATGKVEDWLSILKEAEKIEGEAPGYRFRYSSAVTQIFIVIAERVENKTWAKIFEERVWGKMTARLAMQPHLTPDGTSVAHGLLSTTAEDFARFGMLFTPSWDKAAVKPVVSAEVLRRLQTAGSPEAYRRGAKYEGQKKDFGESPLMNSLPLQDGSGYAEGDADQGDDHRHGHTHPTAARAAGSRGPSEHSHDAEAHDHAQEPARINAVYVGLTDRTAVLSLQRTLSRYRGEPLTAVLPNLALLSSGPLQAPPRPRCA